LRSKSRRFRLRGGAGNCLNNHTAAGLPIDPISLETIPLNKIIRVPLTFERDEGGYEVPTPTTDYHCFNQKTLVEWVRLGNPTNPLTGEKFDRRQIARMEDQFKGSVEEYASFFSALIG
jgi:hypothetical protein